MAFPSHSGVRPPGSADGRPLVPVRRALETVPCELLKGYAVDLNLKQASIPGGAVIVCRCGIDYHGRNLE